MVAPLSCRDKEYVLGGVFEMRPDLEKHRLK